MARAQALQEAEIAAREEIERARIASERGLDEARVGRDLALRRLEVARERDVETALMDKAIALFQKSLEESAAKVEAEALRARAAEAEERVTTARDSEAARRRTSIEVMLAQKDAEEKRIAAQAEQVRAAVAAEAQKLLYEAENVLTDGARYGLFRRRLLDRIEGIVRESVKPMEKIEGIRILQVDGLSGGGGGRGDGRSPTDEVIELGAALPRAGADDRPGAEGDRHRGRQPVQARRPHARGERHAAGRQGGGRGHAEGAGPVAGRLPVHPLRAATRAADRRKARWQRSIPPASSTPPRPRSGRACATSMACPAGIRPSARAASRTASRPTRSAASATSACRNGDRIREQLLGLSDYDMFCTYSILESPMGVENYVATLRLTPVTDGARTFMEWTAEFDCAPEREAELVSNIGTGVFQGGFDALKRQFGG